MISIGEGTSAGGATLALAGLGTGPGAPVISTLGVLAEA
ncbi:Hypothetical protein FBFL15_2312 [Flavobacterium branchiophilum FL-15]|uniref:Uncharacterized protein n=1 Tax=Flavobacterium branchiophilum (strain FL-15) TaxID=1034807 RepID=G2Z2Z7_FLABF|nr:Hypothetical protein FBFL15_2312 [Flavobacterium branchiophilum FL-15]